MFVLRRNQAGDGWEATCEVCGAEFRQIWCVIGRIMTDTAEQFLGDLRDHCKVKDRPGHGCQWKL